MIYALVHFPDVDLEPINSLRIDYDPQFDLIAPHITVIFPVPDSIGEQNLTTHIQTVLQNWQPFQIRLKGLLRSSDGYLFLAVEKGEADLIRLHNDLYTDLLFRYLNKDIQFIPHVTLGAFAVNNDRYIEARERAEALSLDHECVVDKLHLIKINNDRSLIVWSKELQLTHS